MTLCEAASIIHYPSDPTPRLWTPASRCWWSPPLLSPPLPSPWTGPPTLATAAAAAAAAEAEAEEEEAAAAVEPAAEAAAEAKAFRRRAAAAETEAVHRRRHRRRRSYRKVSMGTSGTCANAAHSCSRRRQASRGATPTSATLACKSRLYCVGLPCRRCPRVMVSKGTSSFRFTCCRTLVVSSTLTQWTLFPSLSIDRRYLFRSCFVCVQPASTCEHWQGSKPTLAASFLCHDHSLHLCSAQVPDIMHMPLTVCL